jgi:hypothetical protein
MNAGRHFYNSADKEKTAAKRCINMPCRAELLFLMPDTRSGHFGCRQNDRF